MSSLKSRAKFLVNVFQDTELGVEGAKNFTTNSISGMNPGFRLIEAAGRSLPELVVQGESAVPERSNNLLLDVQSSSVQLRIPRA